MTEREQGLLFPELDPFLTKVKDIDYIDLSEIKPIVKDNALQNELSFLPKGKYFLFKSGGLNKYMPDEGNSFPYVQNTETGKIKTPTISESFSYPCHIIHEKINGETKAFHVPLHRTVAQAFIVNDNPKLKKIVDHKDGNRLDYRVGNLRWASRKENGTNKNSNKEQMNLLRKARVEKNVS